MVQGIDKLKFDLCKPPITQHGLDLLNSIPFKLPLLYMQLLYKHDGASMNYDFEYYDACYNKITYSGISTISGTESKYDNIIREYQDPPEFFPKGILSFSITGNGDMICFDYRTDPKTDNPPIVYWNHEADEEKNVSFIAKDFESFIEMLEEPDPEEIKWIDELLAKEKR